MTTTPLTTSIWRLVGAVTLLAAPFFQVNAAGLKVLSEEDLSKEVGRDGLSIALDLHLEIGSYAFTPYEGASLQHNNLTAKGTVIANFDIVANDPGKPDIGMWYFPMISTIRPLQIESDMVVSANGRNLTTTVAYKDIVPNGSAFLWTTGPTGGIDLGLAMNLSIGQIMLSPNERPSTDGQMEISGIKIESSEISGSPWVVADLKKQSGKFRLPVDSQGVSRLQLGVDWPVGAYAQTGRLSIDKVAFSDGTNLGSSSIGSMQIQYLNIKFR